MPMALTVDLGWPWWAITIIACAVVVLSLGVLVLSRNPAARAVGALLAVEGVVIAIAAPFVMSDMDGSESGSAAGEMRSNARSAVIHVIEHAPGPNMRMVGGVLTFANPIVDDRNAKRIGRDQGFCLDIAVPIVKSSECVWTTFLPGGQITTEGPLSDTERSFVAITGGTGKFANARGWAEEKVHNKAGTEFDVIFHLGG
jgi:allene oxide cyclase